MKSIGEFFSNIQNRHAQEMFLRTVVQQVLKRVANVDSNIKDISFKAGAVILKKISPTAKSQLFLKKQAILREIAIQAPGKRIADLKLF